jgi:hypothetical protein
MAPNVPKSSVEVNSLPEGFTGNELHVHLLTYLLTELSHS